MLHIIMSGRISIAYCIIRYCLLTYINLQLPSNLSVASADSQPQKLGRSPTPSAVGTRRSAAAHRDEDIQQEEGQQQV